MLSKLNVIFDRRMRLKVIIATMMTVVIALLDTAAITLVLPLVDLATGSDASSGIASRISVVLGGPDPRTLAIALAAAVVGLFVLKDLGAMAYSWWLAGFKSFERVKLQSQLLRHFVTSPYTVISRRSSSDMIRTLSDAVTQVFGTIVFGLMSLVSNVVSIAAILIALVFTAPVPTLAVLLYFGVAIFVYVAVIKPVMARAGAEAAHAAGDGWRTAFAALGGIKELSLRDTKDFFVTQYRNALLRGALAERSASFLGGLPKYLLEILFIIAVGGVLALGSSASADGGSTLGVVSLFVAAGFRVLPSVTGLLGNMSQLRYGGPYLDIVHDEVLDARGIESQAEEPGPELPFRDVLSVEKLSFRYPGGERDVLSEVSLTVPHGASVALVGSSGAGKTTLADLLLGLHDPSSGRIVVDGVDIAGRKRRWQKNLGYVAQDIYLLDATLAENIAFDQERNDIDESLLWRSIHQSQLEELVEELPEGVDTPLGERGARLSGGQKQRVGLARALYRQPTLLVLDEATSALDNETEHRIAQTITALHGEITVVIIAHRLSTIRHCDQVAFMRDGRVEAVGTFEEVQERSAHFAQLVRLGALEPTMPEDGRPTPPSQ